MKNHMRKGMMTSFLKSNIMVAGMTIVILVSQDVSGTMQDSDRTDAENSTELTKPSVTKDMNSRAYSLRDQTKTAIRDLAGRENTALNAIKVERVENVTWRDGSLGCPQKGTSYTQALVPGVLIVLKIDEVEYEYHASSDGIPQYCANPAPANDVGV